MSETKRNVPKLRFPGFTEDWEQRKLGDVIASLYNGQTPSRFDKANWEGDIPWLTSGELNRGVVNHSIEKITQQGRDDANLKIVPKGTVVIAITGLEAAGTRGNCAKLGFNTTLNQSCMAIYPKSEFLDPDFLFQWYIAVGEEYGIKYTQGTKQQSYNAELIKILPISVPSVTEQRKITRILDLFDDIITLHQRKLENLKLKKKALLQKLFPKNGEQIPELRFPGFSDDWEQRKLWELYERVNERNDGTLGRDKWISVAKMYFQDPDKVQSNNLDTRTYVMQLGDIAFEGHPNNEFKFGRFVLNDIGTGIISELFPIYRAIVEYDLNFWKYAIQLERTMAPIFAKSITSSGNSSNKLNQNHFLQQSITIPTVEEQKVIGSFLENISNLITLHQRKLEHLQLQKKALLQQMFV